MKSSVFWKHGGFPALCMSIISRSRKAAGTKDTGRRFSKASLIQGKLSLGNLNFRRTTLPKGGLHFTGAWASAPTPFPMSCRPILRRKNQCPTSSSLLLANLRTRNSSTCARRCISSFTARRSSFRKVLLIPVPAIQPIQHRKPAAEHDDQHPDGDDKRRGRIPERNERDEKPKQERSYRGDDRHRRSVRPVDGIILDEHRLERLQPLGIAFQMVWAHDKDILRRDEILPRRDGLLARVADDLHEGPDCHFLFNSLQKSKPAILAALSLALALACGEDARSR